jgi:hypothetical protein
MRAVCDRARFFWEDAVDALRGALVPARRPADGPRRRKASLQVEQLEGRIALSRATPVAAPAAEAHLSRFLPERRAAGGLSSGMSDGSGWYLEVRKAHARGGKWHWQGPFANPTKARANLRHHGMVVRGQRMLTAADASLLDQLTQLPDPLAGLPPLPQDAGPALPDPGPGPTQPQYLQGYEVQGLHPVLGWISITPREVFTNSFDAYQDVLNREMVFYPILYRYVPVSLPADQWHVLGNRIYPNF